MSSSPATSAHLEVWPDPWSDAGQRMDGPTLYPVHVLSIDHDMGSARIKHLTPVPAGGRRTYDVDLDDITVQAVAA